ncbi:MAG: hypothetical protein ACLUB2_02170 [Butyricicoccus pullicaecorum]
MQAGDYTGSKLGLDMQDEVSGALTLNLGVISMDVSGAVHIQADIRYPASASQKLCKSSSALTGFGYTEVDVRRPSISSPTPCSCARCWRPTSTNGIDSQPLAIGGATYARALPCAIAFGPLFLGKRNSHTSPMSSYPSTARSMTQIYICALCKLMEM